MPGLFISTPNIKVRKNNPPRVSDKPRSRKEKRNQGTRKTLGVKSPSRVSWFLFSFLVRSLLSGPWWIVFSNRRLPLKLFQRHLPRFIDHDAFAF